MSGRSGFTLVELMVTVAVAAVILTAGVPGFAEFVKNNRLTTATNELLGALNLARSEAIKRGIRVTACTSSDGTACAATGNWAQGWIVFTDPNNDAGYDSSSDTLLRVQQAIEGNISMTGNSSVSSYISYTADGQSKLTSGAFQAGTIKVCDDRSGKVGRNIILIQTGRVRLETGVSCP